jgi:hypothetical protein
MAVQSGTANVCLGCVILCDLSDLVLLPEVK